MASWFGLRKRPPGGEGDGDDLSDAIQKIPEDTLGLRLLGPALAEANVDIVAVHGLGGDAFQTWTADNGKLWLRDFLPDQLKNPPDDFKNSPNDTSTARVMTFGYDASLFTKASNQRSFTFAETLLAQLSDRRTGDARTRPLILIGHSLGGIVIKKALVMAQTRQPLYGDILRSVVHLCFFGTPHHGAIATADFLRSLGSALTRAKEGSVLKELRLWSPSLIEANSHFADIADGFTITTFFETEAYRGVKVVDEGSAKLNKSQEKCVGLNRNHITMCKFASVDEASYRQVFSRLHAEISAIGTKEQIKEQEMRVQLLLKIQTELRNEGPDGVLHKLISSADSSKSPVVLRSDILSWIPCADFRVQYRGHLKKLIGKIGERPLNSKIFQDWYEGRNRWLWCHGMPGAGKTAFATIVIRHILEVQKADPRKIGILFLYCSHSNKSQSALLFVRTILHQLVEQSETPSPEILSFYNKHESMVPPSVPSIEEYEQAIKQEARQFHKVYLVVDALDECRDDDNDQYELDTRNRLLQAFRNFEDKIHLLITSRNDSLPTTSVLGFDNPISRLKVLTTDEDIEAYVDGRIRVAPKLQMLLDQSQTEEIKKTMVEKAAGMFLPAQLYMNFLVDKARKRSADIVMDSLRALPSFDDEEIEKNYQLAYQEILNNIWDQDQNDVDVVRKVLSWVIFTEDPSGLTLSIVQNALSLEYRDCRKMAVSADYNNGISEQDLLLVCRGLVTIDHESRTISFVHYTAETYFSSTEVRQEFFPNAQAQLAQTCLQFLLSADPEDRSLHKHHLYHYASRHWGHHAHFVEELLQEQIGKFLENYDCVVDCFQLVVDALPDDWKPPTVTESKKARLDPLHVAAYFGLKLTATKLLKAGIDLELADCRGWTPMRWAIIGATEEMVALLSKHNASIVSKDCQGKQTVFWAVGSRVSEFSLGNWDISSGARSILGEVILMKSEQSFMTALSSSVIPRTSPSVVQFLFNNLPSADLRVTTNGRTLLSVVAENWQWDAVKLLLKHGASVDLEDKNGMTPLLWALQSPRCKSIFKSIVIREDARLNIGDMSNVESSAELNIDDNCVSEETIEPMICRLIGSNLEARDGAGRTALSLAAENRFHVVLDRLLREGADPNTFDCKQMTPLHYACSLPCFRTVVIQALECEDSARVRLGATKLPQLPLAKVRRPLAAQPVERSVNLLLQHGSECDAKNSHGFTALDLAISDGLESIVVSLKRLLNTSLVSLTLCLDDGRPNPSHTSKGDVQDRNNCQDLEYCQRSDYTKLLLAMLDRRARFQLDFVRTLNASNLLISSTSDIRALQIEDASQVLITDKPKITQVSASGASVVIIRAAAKIDKLFTSDASQALIEGFSQIASVCGSDHSKLTTKASSKITSLIIGDSCLVLARGHSEIGQVKGSHNSMLRMEANSKITNLVIGGCCLVLARGHSEIGQVEGSHNSRLEMEANSKITNLVINDSCLILARGHSETIQVEGSGNSMLVTEADSKITTLGIDDNCLIAANGRIDISQLVGRGCSTIFFQADGFINSAALYDQCSLFLGGEVSQIREINNNDCSTLTIMGNLGDNHQPRILEVHDDGSPRLNRWNPDLDFQGYDSNIGEGTANLRTDTWPTDLSEPEALVCLRETSMKSRCDNMLSRIESEASLRSSRFTEEFQEEREYEQSNSGNEDMSYNWRQFDEEVQELAISIEKECCDWVSKLDLQFAVQAASGQEGNLLLGGPE